MTDKDRYQRATEVLDEIYPTWREQGTDASAMPGALGAFARTCVEHCYTDAWARKDNPTFDYKTRSLITMAVLATLGSEHDLAEVTVTKKDGKKLTKRLDGWRARPAVVAHDRDLAELRRLPVADGTADSRRRSGTHRGRFAMTATIGVETCR